jgi:hypothetical protein
LSSTIFLSFEIYAFAIVISMLVAVMIRVIVVACAMNQTAPKQQPGPVRTALAETEEVPIAAIAAAVYAVVGPHRIVHIKRSSQGHDWKTEGRSTHHLSHNIPRRRP